MKDGVVHVLDHGYVRLVDHMGSDLSIVRSARVSHDADWRAGENEGSDRRLINYLMKNRHTSPFESVTFTFEVKAPIFVFRQWHRHRTQSYNELSARYSELPEDFYIPSADSIGTQSKSNKQARDTTAEQAKAEEYRDMLKEVSETNFICYRHALSQGIPRELARCFLSVNTYSRMFATMNLHNLFHFLKLRLDSHAQYEIQVYAKAMLDLIKPIVPAAVQAWEENQ